MGSENLDHTEVKKSPPHRPLSNPPPPCFRFRSCSLAFALAAAGARPSSHRLLFLSSSFGQTARLTSHYHEKRMDLYGRETSSRSNQPRGRGSKAKPASTAAMTDAKEEPPKPILRRLVKDKLVLFVVVGAGEGDGGGHELTPVVVSGAGEGGGRRSPGQGRRGRLRREHPHLHPQPLSHGR